MHTENDIQHNDHKHDVVRIVIHDSETPVTAFVVRRRAEERPVDQYN